MSNACVQQIIFSTLHDFQTCFDTKKCLPAIETSIISRLDIALPAPKSDRLIFLMSAEKGRETTYYYQHESNNRVRHCSRTDDDFLTYSVQHSILGSKF